MGWIPDLPDPRDYGYRHQAVLPLLERLRRPRWKNLPDEVDLRRDDEGIYFKEPEDQGAINSSTSFAVLSLVEYFQRRVYGRTFEPSKLFLYKVTRNLRQRRPVAAQGSHSVGDTGADLRTTLKTLASVGVPASEVWPYDVEKFDEEPTPFCYAVAKPLTGIAYFRLDEPNSQGSATWKTVTSFLAAGFPVAFGFPVPSSLTADACIPYRGDLDSVRNLGQAAVAIGYKNDFFGGGHHALRIRCSWGSRWGEAGNGWLPGEFLRKKLAGDFWTLVSENWVESGELTRPSVIDGRQVV